MAVLLERNRLMERRKPALVFLFLIVSNGASAELYKCSDASGAVTYQATPCVDMNEEVIKVDPAPPSVKEPENPFLLPPDDSIFDKDEQPPEGKPSSASSPLARAHAAYQSALSSCRKGSLMPHLSRAGRADLEQLSAVEFRLTCELMKKMNRSDYRNARETYNGNNATLVWHEKSEERDGNQTFRSEMTETVNFVKENGRWVIGD